MIPYCKVLAHLDYALERSTPNAHRRHSLDKRYDPRHRDSSQKLSVQPIFNTMMYAVVQIISYNSDDIGPAGSAA